jgi:hypothetical protein
MSTSGWIRRGCLVSLALSFAACGRTDAVDDPIAGDPAQEIGSPMGGVERTSPAPPAEPPPPSPADAVIQTQEGSPGHVHVDLTRVQVTGDVLTAQLRFRNTSESHGFTMVTFPVDEVSYIDDATTRRYGVLVDEAGSPMAAPLQGESVWMDLRGGQSAVVWFRFAAPEPHTQTISLNVPGVGPFDRVPVSR